MQEKEATTPLESVHPDDVSGSVGLVTKEFYSFGTPDEPFVLENRQILNHVDVAYETWGTLNERRDNVILVLHGLTGSSHAAGKYAPQNRTLGFWDGMIGPGKVFDTDKYFVVCANTLGGCRGTTGPMSINPATGKPYGLSFPIITIRDMNRVHQKLLEHLGIKDVLLVTGGSMGGMQALEWAIMYPDQVRAVAPIATSSRLSARGIAFNEVARRAIRMDPKWRHGEYYDHPDGGPDAGLALARMIGTITYLNDEVMESMFGRKPASEESALERDLHARFDVERYLHDEGNLLVRRFDANSYLYLTKAVDLHDVSRGYRSLEEALARIRAKMLLIAICSDDLFPPRETEEVAGILERQGRHVRYFLMDSAYGHDAFLVEYRKMLPPLREFMSEIEQAAGSDEKL